MIPATLSLVGLARPAIASAPRVQSVAEAVAGLAVEMGRSLGVDLALRGVPVLLDEPGRSSAQRLGDLAFALHASLVRDGATLRLVRSADDRHDLASIHHKRVQNRIEASMAERNRLLQRSRALGDEAAQAQAAQAAFSRVRREIDEAHATGRTYVAPTNLVHPRDFSPEGRLFDPLVRRIGAAALATIPPHGVRFFSDHPNAAESPLPPCADLLAEYDRRRKEVDGTPGVTRAKVVVRADEDGVIAQIYDAQGRRLGVSGHNWANRSFNGFDPPAWGGPNADWRPLDAVAQAMTAFLRHDAEAMGAGYARAYDARAFAVPPVPEVPAPYLHPERQDPLDFAVREGVLALPRSPKSSGLVAVLADWTLDSANDCVHEGRLDAAAFVRNLFKGLTDQEDRTAFERVAHDGATVLRPADEAFSEASLADRATLGKAVRRAMADRAITLQNWPAIHFSLYGSRQSEVAKRYLGALLVAGLRFPEGLIGQTPSLLALLGAALAQGGPLIDASGPPLREILRNEAAEDSSTLFDSRAGVSDLDLAPSTVLASGALDRARIALATSEAVLMDVGDDGKPFLGNEPESWRGGTQSFYPAPFLRRSEARTLQLFEARYLKRTFRLGRRQRLAMAIRFGSLERRIEFEDKVLERENVRFDELPAVYREYVLQGVRKTLTEEGATIPPALQGGTPP